MSSGTEPTNGTRNGTRPLAPDPSPGFRARHTPTQWAVLVVNVLVIAVCLVAAGALVYGKGQLDNTLAAPAVSIETSTTAAGVTPGNDPQVTFPSAGNAPANFLITGSDVNACVDADSPWAGAADPAREQLGSRSDTIMVLRLDPAARRASVLSFPRDLWVSIPGKAKNRINTATEPGDSRLLAQTIYDNFGITIDHYLQVDFCAFKLIVDAVGGVKVPFQYRIKDANVALDVPAGCHTFSGDEALAYVRSRHLKWIDENGTANEDRGADLGRISRQQDFLRRTLQAALEKGVFDPSVAQALIESLQKYIVRDQTLLAIDSILQFAGVLRDVDPASITTYQIDALNIVVGGKMVLDPKIDGPNMQAVLAVFRGDAPVPDGSAPPPTAPAAADTTAPPSVAAVPEENVKGDIVPNEDIVC